MPSAPCPAMLCVGVIVHVYRWDLDKTYLDTNLSSVRSMIRSAFETAGEKRNVPGSAALLRGLVRCDPACRVAIVSGSPEQLRQVLEEKLALDGVRFDRLVLKDHIGNLKRGRLKAVTGQLGYKLPQILEQRAGLGHAVRETLFGDDTEVDAVVYALYAELAAGRVSEAALARVMEKGDAYPDTITRAVTASRSLTRGEVVEDIFIHVDRGVSLRTFRLLGPLVIPVFSWFQASVVLWTRQRLDPAGVAQVARDCAQDGTLDGHALASLLQDLVRRGRVSADAVAQLLTASPVLADLAPNALDAVRHVAGLPTPTWPARPDFIGFLSKIR